MGRPEGPWVAEFQLRRRFGTHLSRATRDASRPGHMPCGIFQVHVFSLRFVVAFFIFGLGPRP